MTRPTVLFLCVHNAGRSQMAAAYARADGRVDVRSGGSAPGEAVNPAVVAAMAEVGLDVSGERPVRFTDEMIRAADVVVTMGCGDECPYVPGVRYLDWELDDPAGMDLAGVRVVRDEIATRVAGLIDELVAAS
ncbi:MAG TPA: arsenate reductase ArsC [Acidimicrobiales bacterium]|nr:arsenate reductase ArsC [Acidimicrobiales bacterium]